MRTKNEWRLHPVHGFMLRGPEVVFDGRAYCQVVTSLLRDNIETERNAKLWAAQALRLRVNAGCGQIAADLMRANDLNPEFKPIDGRKVPRHIRKDFTAHL